MDHSLAQYLFHQGTNYRSYEYFGAHFEKVGGKSGVIFRVWANNAESVSVVGDFNGWNDGLNVMQNLGNGIFELFIAFFCLRVIHFGINFISQMSMSRLGITVQS